MFVSAGSSLKFCLVASGEAELYPRFGRTVEWDTAAGRDIVWRLRSKKSPALLVKIIQNPETKKEERDRYIRAIDFLKGPEKEAALIQLLAQ